MTYPVIDLFAGPGGLGEGFSAFEKSTGRRPFSNVLSVEKDEAAHRTLLLRSFYRQFEPTDVPEDYLSYLQGDITRDALFNAHKREANAAMREAVCLELGVSPYAEVRELISQRLKDSSKWVLVGGPPCQAYSLAGRSRMRTTRPDFEKDERHFLYVEYLKILADHMPPIFVMENVKGLLSATHKGDRIVEKIFADLKNPSKAVKGRSSGRGYKLFSLSQRVQPEHLEPSDFIIKAEKYGIPQARHRLLILGIRDDLDITPDILTEEEAPSVSDVIGDLPKIRSTLSKEIDDFELWRTVLSEAVDERWYIHGKANGLFPTISEIDNALIGLQSAKLSTGGEYLKYRSKPKAHSAWYLTEGTSAITNHVARGHMRSDLHRYLFASAYAKANDRSPNLGQFPKALLPAHKNIEGNIAEVAFADRFRVQVANRPSTTITSHISKDGHYFIHYDPVQCRSLTVREAARLQTFPDSYKFEGNRTSQYHQVGNAVPPLLAMKIAEVVHDILKRIRV